MRAKVEIRPATADDIAPIVARIRESDRRECLAQTLLQPADAIAFVLGKSSQAWAGTVDGAAVCLFGVFPSTLVTPDHGRPWMVGTDAVETYQRAFLRRNRAIISEMKSRYSVLENWVDMRNDTSRKWLAWLGFTIHDAEPHGPLGRPFHRFTLGA